MSETIADSPDDLVGRRIGELGDSALAHSLRRRRRELNAPEEAIAGHDSSM